VADEESHASIRGGPGDDRIYGDIHAELWFDRGDGHDTYGGYANDDGDAGAQVQAGALARIGIASSDVALQLQGDDLLLGLGLGDAITLDGYFADTGSTKRGAEAQISIGDLHFEGGELRDLRSWFTSGTNAADSLAGTAGSDLIAGYLGYDKLDGGAGADGLHGGVGNDTLLGGEGNDTLVGSTGTDSLLGGNGDDAYWIDDMDRPLTETEAGGTDSVMYEAVRYSPVTDYALLANFENLVLIEAGGGLDGYGNSLANHLTGNSAANMLGGKGGTDTLFGLEGADTLDGGRGSDRLEGGQGGDSYWFTTGYGKDTVVEKDAAPGAIDEAVFLGLAQDQVKLVQVGDNLEARVIGTKDKLVFKDWYLGSKYQVEEFVFADGTWDAQELLPAGHAHTELMGPWPEPPLFALA
jgi:Ca2+-binding RTX toxin-like protein